MRAGAPSRAHVYHVTTPEDWRQARVEGAYRLSTRGRRLEEVGFVHCSYRHQLLAVAEGLYADAAELVVLVVDTRRLSVPVRAEPPAAAPGPAAVPERFPHVYGPLELEAVVQALPLHRGPDGRFRLPSDL